jgi:hypothetical protein
VSIDSIDCSNWPWFAGKLLLSRLKININIKIFLLKQPKQQNKTTKTTEQSNQIKKRMALLTRRQKFAIRSLFISGIIDEQLILNYLAERDWPIRIGSIQYICLIRYMVKLRCRRSMQEVQRMQRERWQTSLPSSPLPSIDF